MSYSSLFNTLSRYIRRDTTTNPTIAGPLMAHYIMALLGHNDPVSEMFNRMGGEGGRLGDYVFNQEGIWQLTLGIPFS
jgi:E3 ubiquitin-protein ligase RNF115/126